MGESARRGKIDERHLSCWTVKLDAFFFLNYIVVLFYFVFFFFCSVWAFKKKKKKDPPSYFGLAYNVGLMFLCRGFCSLR